MDNGASGLQPNTRPVLQASKWLQLQVLMDAEEMSDLINALMPFQIYSTGQLLDRGEGRIDADRFLESYAEYVDTLRNGVLPIEESYRSLFTCLWSRSPDLLAVTAVGDAQQVIRPSLPVIQLQPHRVSYSSFDRKFRPMVLGSDSIVWGIQFSYPQIYQDPKTLEIEQIAETDHFPNTALFRLLQRWIRHHTLPTPFLADGERTNVPIRLGKRCFVWINQHPQLAAQGLSVEEK